MREEMTETGVPSGTMPLIVHVTDDGTIFLAKKKKNTSSAPTNFIKINRIHAYKLIILKQ